MMRDVPLDPSPWWRYRMMWLVVGGPVIVVVAAIATAVIAIRGADEVLSVKDEVQRSTAPAMQGRNHAATPAAHRPRNVPTGP